MFCNNLEGWGGVGGELEETCVYLWLIHADVWQKPTQYHKAIVLQLKINKFLTNKKHVTAQMIGSIAVKIKNFLKTGFS